MLIVEAGHVYDLSWLDGAPKEKQNRLIFVSRELHNRHAGTQTQEVLRALIDRTMHCDNCVRWPGNVQIIKHLRAALVLHEARALERMIDKGHSLEFRPIETLRTGPDGHFVRVYEGASQDAKRYTEHHFGSDE